MTEPSTESRATLDPELVLMLQGIRAMTEELVQRGHAQAEVNHYLIDRLRNVERDVAVQAVAWVAMIYLGWKLSLRVLTLEEKVSMLQELADKLAKGSP